MPTVQELIAENGALRKTVAAQGLAIQQHREAVKRVSGTKVALVAGRFAAEVDAKQEAAKAKEFTEPPSEVFAKMIGVMKFYAAADNYVVNVALDRGQRARDFLTAIGR